MQGLEQLVSDMAEQNRTRFYGKYRGIVKEVLTGSDLGKLIVQVPSVYEEEDSPAAIPCVPFAGDGHGFLFLPEVDDHVWVEFESGDVSHPVWTGFCWLDDEIPDPKGPTTRVIVTKENLKIVMDDDAKKLQLLHPGGAEITLSDSGILIKFGSQQVEITSSGINLNNGSMQVT